MIENINTLESKDLLDVSIIIPCKNEATTLKSTVDSIRKAQNSLSYEIIVVDDGSSDKSSEFLNSPLYKEVKLLSSNSIGCASAKNFGAEIAKGKYLFFCDAHIEVPDNWLDNLVNTLKSSNAHIVAPTVVNMLNTSEAGYGMTCDGKLRAIWLSHKPKGVTEIPFACGCAFGISKEVFEKLNGFDHFFQVYGSEDFEICLKAWLYGYRVVINADIKIKHLFKATHPYKIADENIIFNILCVAYSHFKKERLIKTINIVKNEYSFFKAAADIKLNEDLILKQREKYLNERTYNDDFFFKKFNIPF